MAVYFGPLPAWFGLWAASCARNPHIDFLVVTDQEAEGLPRNVRVLPETLDGVRARLERALGTGVALGRPYKLCDYKPFLGLAFSDELAGYDYWGFSDLDLVLGDLEGFFVGQEVTRYDKFLPLGHLFLFRNTPEVNARVKLPVHGRDLWREVVSSEENRAFDEFGINEIYAEHGFPAYMGHPMADITIAQRRFTLGFRFGMRDGRYQASVLRRYPNYERQVFYWRGGTTGRLALDRDKLVDERFLYVHFQKRHFTKEMVRVRPGDDFYLGSEGFVPMAGLDAGEACEAVNPHDTLTEKLGGGCPSMLGGFSARQGGRSSAAARHARALDGLTDSARPRMAGGTL
jgi:hypothetical protein